MLSKFGLKFLLVGGLYLLPKLLQHYYQAGIGGFIRKVIGTLKEALRKVDMGPQLFGILGGIKEVTRRIKSL